MRSGLNPNCWFGRPYGPPIAFVVHTQSGGESGTVAELLSGTIDNWIDPADRAWSNGILEPGNAWALVAQACGVDPALNPNHVTITCETEDRGDPGGLVSARQFEAVLYAAGEATRRYPKSLRYLLSHADISPQSRPDCPGERWLASGQLQMLADELGLKTVSS